MNPLPLRLTVATGLLALTTACGADGSSAAPQSADASASARVPRTPLEGTPDPAGFGGEIDNPLLPLQPGTRWVYRSSGEDETRIVTTVTHRTRSVQGITCVVVHDVESTLDGKVLEDTYDWYAQDDAGNVWYFGEDTTAYEDGKASTEGSWEAGVDGAQAGIAMLAEPTTGDSYEQEYYEGEAEDHGEVLEVAGHDPAVPGRFGPLVITRDTTPLEPKLVEQKYYARGVGVVREETVNGGDEQVRLVTSNVDA